MTVFFQNPPVLPVTSLSVTRRVANRMQACRTRENARELAERGHLVHAEDVVGGDGGADGNHLELAVQRGEDLLLLRLRAVSAAAALAAAPARAATTGKTAPSQLGASAARGVAW